MSDRSPPPAGTRATPPPLILEIPQDEGDEFPDYVLIRQGLYARAYAYPPGSDAGAIFLRYQAALEWCCQAAWMGGDIDGGDFQSEMVERGVLVEVPASEEFKAEWQEDTMFVMAWRKDA